MEYKSQKVDGEDVIYSSDWIHDLESPQHFNWYWNQAHLVYKYATREDLLLELGCGTNLLSDVLRRRGFAIKTLDIDPDKRPDYTNDASSFDYTSENFTGLVAFEVFEHIPWTTLERVLDRIAQSNISKVLFSVPWHRTTSQIAEVQVRGLPKLRFGIPRRRVGSMTPAHFWELSKSRSAGTYGQKQLRSMQDLNGLFVDRGFRLSPSHRENHIQFMVAHRMARVSTSSAEIN